MPNQNTTKENRLEKAFLNERFMAAVCMVMTAAGVVSFALSFQEQDAFEKFTLLVKMVTAINMFLAFRSFKWDAVKGLMGGVLFCLMYQDAYLALAELWSEQNFDAYLASGVQGSLFLAGAGMNLLMTIIITANHIFINLHNARQSEKCDPEPDSPGLQARRMCSPDGDQQPVRIFHCPALDSFRAVSDGHRPAGTGGLPGNAV
ncbi:MAG: hypothetical protein IJQ88_09930 [Clostridia bacterium]|nr:hypothetical protein [Clostridia bacterium]